MFVQDVLALYGLFEYIIFLPESRHSLDLIVVSPPVVTASTIFLVNRFDSAVNKQREVFSFLNFHATDICANVLWAVRSVIYFREYVTS